MIFTNLKSPKQVKINHRENYIKFGSEMESNTDLTHESCQDRFRSQLMNIAQAMDKVIAIIAPREIQVSELV